MQELPPDSLDTFKHSLISNYYPNRCTNLADKSLHHMVANYTWVKKQELGPKDKNYAKYTDEDKNEHLIVFKPRREPHIVCPTYEPSIRDPAKRIEYCFNMLQLHVPWTCEADIFGPIQDPTDIKQVLLYFMEKVEQFKELGESVYKREALERVIDMAKEWQREAANEPEDMVCHVDHKLISHFQPDKVNEKTLNAMRKEFADAVQSAKRELKTVAEYEAMLNSVSAKQLICK